MRASYPSNRADILRYARFFGLSFGRQIPKLAAAKAVEPSMYHRGPRKVDAAWLFQTVALFAALNSASATDYYVDPSDARAYATVQEAVDAVGGQSEFNRANIFIAPGMYREAVSVAKPYVSFIGTG